MKIYQLRVLPVAALAIKPAGNTVPEARSPSAIAWKHHLSKIAIAIAIAIVIVIVIAIGPSPKEAHLRNLTCAIAPPPTKPILSSILVIVTLVTIWKEREEIYQLLLHKSTFQSFLLQTCSGTRRQERRSRCRADVTVYICLRNPVLRTSLRFVQKYKSEGGCCLRGGMSEVTRQLFDTLSLAITSLLMVGRARTDQGCQAKRAFS